MLSLLCRYAADAADVVTPYAIRHADIAKIRYADAYADAVTLDAAT